MIGETCSLSSTRLPIRSLFKEIIPVSALTGEGLDVLEKCISQTLPEGPPYFPEDMVTDLSERFLVGELIREKVFRLISQEVPYGVAVTIETFKEREDKPIIDIQATIHVERTSQKGILIGKQGKMLKTIGQQAREDMEILVGDQGLFGVMGPGGKGLEQESQVFEEIRD